MKKAFVAVAMILAVGLMANVALTDETVPFPYWQHTYGLATFWSIANAGGDNAVVTINLFEEKFDEAVADTYYLSTTATVEPGQSWMPDTSLPTGTDMWYLNAGGGESAGYGNFEIANVTTDSIYLWACVYSDLGSAAAGGNGVPGYTIVMPGNPYGVN